MEEKGTLEFIFGSAKSNSIDIIMKMIDKELNNGNEKIILLVPEQISFEIEKEALRRLKADRMNKILILSFTRLCHLVFNTTGNALGTRINDSLRAIMLGMILNNSEVKRYSRREKESEMIELLLTTVKEFKSQGVTAQALDEISSKVSSGKFKDKLNYVASVMNEYDKLILDNKYVDPLDDLTRLASILNTNKIFDGYSLFIDSFISFTNQQYEVIKALFNQCGRIVASLCIDHKLIGNNYLSSAGCNDLGIFDISSKTIKKLHKLASSNDKKVSKPIVLDTNIDNELDFLEKNIFRNNRKKYHQEVNRIKIYQAASIYEECDFVAESIKKLIMTGEYEYRDFSIVIRNVKEYDGIIDLALKRYDLPYFMGENVDIESKPLVKFIFSLIDVIRTNFSSEYVLKYVKTGLLEINQDDISLLENYIFIWDIDRDAWFKDFEDNPNGFGSSDDDQEILSKINQTRRKIIDPLLILSEKIKKSTGGEVCAAIYDFMEGIEIPRKIMERSEKFKELGQLYLANEETQVWKVLIEIFDQMVVMLENTRVTLKEFQRLFKIAMATQDILSIPHGLDEIKIYSADKMVFSPSKVFFVLGAVMGKFPKVPEYQGLFNFSERKELIQFNIEIYDFVDDLSSQERFLAYKAVTSSTDLLFVTCFKSNVAGELCRPSEIMNQIKYIFPSIEFLKNDNNKDILSKEQAFECCGRFWNDNSLISEALKEYFKNQPEYLSRFKSLENAANKNQKQFENKEVSNKLVGRNFKVSASKLESFYSCRFAYFCKYVLGAKERRKISFDFIQYGNVMHYLLENVLSSKDISDDNISNLLYKYMDEKLGGIKNKTERFKYLFFRISKTIKMLVSYILKELDQSEFVPIEYELEISHGGNLNPLKINIDNNSSISVEGKIDRVDIMIKDNKKYIRIIDYKTGSKKFELTDVLYGINMQMLIYLLSICNEDKSKYKNYIPAGVLYMPAKLKLDNVDLDKFNDESILSNLKMDGIILNNEEVIRGMEREGKGKFIPVKISKNGISKSSQVMDEEEIQLIRNDHAHS